MPARARGRARRGVPVLVMAAVLGASVLAGAPAPVRAVDGVADNRAVYSACVGPAAESAGFGDTEGTIAEDAADCLAHYGITLGTAEGVYSPDQVVPRWQMALFLVRAAAPAGIAAPAASDQGFEDLDRLGTSAREAIDVMVALGIMEGTSAKAFSPFAPVLRHEMALWLARFLQAAPAGPGGAAITLIEPDDTVFADLGEVRVGTARAIARLYEMGVTGGTSRTTFSPNGQVSRAQMAVFITRMLAHTNARPVGLTVQTSETEVFKRSDIRLALSLRDPDHRPVADRNIDMFRASDPDRAFDQDGMCTGHVSPLGGTRPCIVDASDRMTDTAGNLLVTVDVGNVERLRVWSWTGANGSRFDEDSASPAVVDVETRSGASVLEVSDDMGPTARQARYGDSVTFTFRLLDEDGDPVARSGVELSLDVMESRDNGVTFDSTRIIKKTGPDGDARVTFLHNDPSGRPGDVARLDLDMRSSGGFRVVDKTTIGMVRNDGAGSDPFLDWKDEAAAPTTLKLTLAREYRTASSAGDGAASTVRASLTDQYGNPIPRKTIVFTSNDPSGVPAGVRRVTNSRGVATLNYQRDDATSRVETITARFDQLVGRAGQYWVATVTGNTTGTGVVRVVEKDHNRLVVTVGNGALIIEYDANDQYNLGAEGITLVTFEEHLTVGDTLMYTISGPGSATINNFSLTNA